MAHIDLASLLPVMALQLIYSAVKWRLIAGQVNLDLMVFEAVINLISLILSGLMGLLFLSVVLSWLQPLAPINGLLAQLARPVLAPIRRVLPPLGGIDLSFFVALLILQVFQKLLSSLAW